MEFMKDIIGLSPEVAQAIEDMGFEAATPIQEAAIPPMLEGKDIIGQAQTGTGKTAAFGIPLVEKLDVTDRSVQALVLCPTRELALQTAGELMKLSRHRPGTRVTPVYGGQPIERQLRALEAGTQVVVGTPGRVMDHMNRGTLDISKIKLVVLDEADEMLDMGFRDDIETILSATPETRQTALFSATMPRPIYMLAKQYLKDPVHVEIARKELTVERIEQSYISVRSFHKGELLSRLLILSDIKLALVFCNTKLGVETVVTDLQHRGFSAAGLHGDMRQIERDAIMARFRNGLINVLVATDVAARGIDVDDIEAVFNYDIPQDVEYYVHRIGRTGRAGKEGRAYTFVVGREVSRMWDYRRITGAKILCQKAPEAAEVQKALRERVMKDVSEKCAAEVDEQLLEAARVLMADIDPERAIAVMLDGLIRETGAKTDAAIDLNPPEPVRAPRAEAPRPQRRVGPYGRPAYPQNAPAATIYPQRRDNGGHAGRKFERDNSGWVNRREGHAEKSERPFHKDRPAKPNGGKDFSKDRGSREHGGKERAYTPRSNRPPRWEDK